MHVLRSGVEETQYRDHIRASCRGGVFTGLVLCACLLIAGAASARTATGTYTGNGLSSQTIEGLGFQPDVVLVKGDLDEYAVIRTSLMFTGYGKELADGKTIRTGFFGAFTGDGFEVASGNEVNASGTRYDWVAFATDPGRMVLGSYIGNGQGNREIDVGFSPDYLIVIPHNNKQGLQRSSPMPYNFCLPFDGGGSLNDRIQSFTAQGFVIGGDDDVNRSNDQYDYIAWRADPDFTTVGTYVGNDNDNRDIDAALTPSWVVVKADSGEDGVHRTSSLASSGNSLFFRDSNNLTNRIQRLQTDGFEVGSDKDVNEGGKDYYWTAIGVVHDLAVTHEADRDTALVGDHVAFTVTLSNTGPDRMSSAFVYDRLPLELEYLSHTANNGSFDPGSGTWKVTQLEPGGAAVLEITTRIRDGSAGGEIVCQATVESHTDNDPDPANNAASASVVVPRTADLSLSGYVDDPFPEVGQTVTLGVGAQNLGPDAATNVLVTGALPAGLEYVSHTVNVGSYNPITGIWSINTLGTLSIALLQINARVGEGAAGQTLAYTPVIAADELDPVPDNDTTTIEVRILAADLVLEKTVDDPVPPPGGQVVFRITLHNDGPDPASTILVRDRFPIGLEYAADVASQGLFDPDTGLWDVGSLFVGGTATLDLVATVAPEASGLITNTAAVLTSNPIDPDTGNNTAAVDINVESVEIHLVGTVNDDRPDVGQTVTFSITAENISIVEATSLIVQDLLPDGLTYVDHVPSTGTYSPVTGRWNIGTLASGASCVLQLSASVDAGTGGTTIVNVASVFGFAEIEQEIRSTVVEMPVTVRAADLNLVKNVDDPTPVQGAEVVFSILATNEGPDTAYGVVAADTLPAGLVYVSDTADHGSYDTATGLWDLGDLPAGDTAILDITAQVQLDVGSGDSATNTAWIIASDQEDPDPGDNSDSAVLTQQSADLALAKSVDDTTPAAGETVVYTLVMSNDGPSAAGGVAALDTLPTGAAYTSHDPPGANYDPVTGLWNIGTLAAGDADTLRISAQIASSASGATLDNEVSVAASDQADPDDSNNRAEAALTVRAADLSVDLTVDDPAPTVGDTVTVALGVANEGPDDSDDAILQVETSSGLELLDWDFTGGDFDPDLGQWALANMPAGGDETLTLSLRVLPGTIGLNETVTAAVVTAAPGDPDPADDADAVELVVRGADLVVGKSVNNPAPFVGESVLFTLTLRNDGPDDVSTAVVADTLPDGLTYVSHTPSWADYDPVGGLWTAGSVADGQTLTLFLQALVSAGGPGEVIVNSAAVVQSDLADPDPANNTDEAAVTIPAADLVVGLSADEPEPALGDHILLTLSVRNEGPDTATGVVLRQVLPPELDYVSSVPGGYDPQSGRWVVGELPEGELAELVVDVLANEDAIGDTLMVSLEVDEVDQDDPVPGNESAAVELRVRPDADLSVALSPDSGSANVGEEVVWTTVLTNLGPSDATGIALRDTLPLGMILNDWDATDGTYDPFSGVWSLAALPPSGSAELILTTEAKPGTGGTDLTGFAGVLSVDQSDRVKDNNAAAASLHILGAGLRLASFVDLISPDEGDDVNFTLSVTNLGPDAANGVTVADTIPTGLVYVSHTPPTETFTQSLEGVWLWDVGQVESQTPRVLFVRTRVLENTTGQVLRHAARVLAGEEEDPQPGDNLAVNEITVEGVDLALDLSVDDASPDEGDTLSYLLEITNQGPHDATGVAVRDSLGTGLTLLAVAPTAGFDMETGLWTVGDLDVGETRELSLTVRVDERTGGSMLLHHARVTALDQVDPAPANDAVDLEVAVIVPGEGHVLAAATALPDAPLFPLGEAVDALSLELVNWSVAPDTLDSVTLYNAAEGTGSQEELDASWARLFLWRLDADGRTLLAQRDDPFAGGTATLDDLRLTLAPGDTVRLVAAGSAAAVAHDGDNFGLSLNGADDLVYTRQVATDAAWPLATASIHSVDAFVAAQAEVEPVDAGVLAPGGTHHLALSVILPADGYAPHALNELAVVNLGTARPVHEISAVRAWLDDGDGAFSTIFDEALGDLVWTGDRWVLAGLARTVPVGGARVMISVDAAPMAEGLRSVQLAIPTGGVATDGDADGPLDAPLVNPFAQVVSGSDRLWLSAATIPWRSIHPDGGESLLLHLTATNSFDEPRTLTGLRVTGTVTSSYTTDQAVLDDVVSQFLLRDDADQDGTYTEADETGVLGATSLIGGTADFGGLAWTVPPSATRHLFVTARVSAGDAADGDNVAASVASAVDVQFDGSAELAGNWPLGSGGLVVDGLLASAVAATPVPARTVAPGEGPVLALDLVVPRNGHADDVLGRLDIANFGSATSADIAELRLYRDGGDGDFDAGAADDLDLGLLAPQDGLWTVGGLDEAVGAGGARLFVGVTGAVDFADSTTILLALPVDGLQYASNNDGPLHEALVPGGTLLLSRAPLQVALDAAPDEVIVGQPVTVRMSVRNTGIDAAAGVSPSELAPAGDGGLLLADGPQPSDFDLAPGQVDTFTWTYTAGDVGSVSLTGSASGTAPGGAPLVSLPIATGSVLVVAPPPSLVMAPLSQLPFVVNGGQTDVSALTLDVAHPGDAGSAAVRIDGLAIGFENGQGQPVPAGGVLASVKMRADGVLMQAYAVASDEGPVIQLAPTEALVLSPGTGRVITLDVDVAAGAAGAEFRLVLAQGDLVATDVVAGGGVAVTLDDGAWPVMSELTRVVDGASALDLSAGPAGDPEASQGQTGVRLGSLTVANPGVPELDAGIQLGVAAVSLYDVGGQPLADPVVVLQGLSVWLDGESLGWLDVVPGMTQPFSLILNRLVAVEAGQSATLEIRGDLRPATPVGTYRLAVDDAAAWDARDANSGVPVPVNVALPPLLAEPLDVVTPASRVHLGGRPSGLPELTEGALGQTVLEIDLRHPDEAGTAPVAVDTLRLRCVDALGGGLPTESFLSRVSIRAGGQVVGAVLPNGDPDGYLAVPVADASVAPASLLTLEVAVDLLDGSSVEAFVFLLAPEDVAAVDAHLHTPVEVTADAGVVVPLSTGARAIRVAADELIVAVEDLMPVVISVLGGETPVMRLELENPAPAVAGNLVVDGLVVRTRGDAKSAVSLGSLAHELLAYHGDELWGTSGTLARGDSTAAISPQTPLELAPGVVDELEIRVVLVDEPAAATLTLGLNLHDISARQPEGDLVAVSVLPAPGQVFPFWTKPGTVSAATLEESYSNFPNPFAAGREATTFVFALDGAATVDLRLYTPRGELVRTLLDGAALPAGLYQDVTWDGRNGRGDTVRNGVYVAELSVRADDGSSARLRRKVAVVR